MILGIGTDLAVIARIENAINRHGERFAKRILTKSELERYGKHPQQAAYLAKRFAAKEATAKALGTGIGPISWQDMQVDRAESGAPVMVLSGAAAERIAAHQDVICHLSITDDGGLAQAFVVLESR
ncbi:holo-ACP synthase [Oceanospirillum sp.]|uniref:holo-ACP synthase n=1 Tax=Oceanospirillum sp. TaxID=2021254 RepID=UPI003A915500